ncbi:MAG TPA: FtsX-like permease family protein, partial [Verrucomicrobiae bacterium]|nr:FtsX-like permease family protein [Verrucomicrobiae bacterium]
LAESVLLSVLGAALGFIFAFWSVSGLRHGLGSMSIARAHEVTLDIGVLGFALAVLVLTGVGCGLAPALQASRPNLNHALKDAARGSATGGNRLRSSLIVGEAALALVLLTGAGLLLHSFSRLLSVPPGFDPERALTMQISLPVQKYRDNAQRAAFYSRLTERVAALPGVEAAGVSGVLPLGGGMPDPFFRIRGRANPPEPGYSADFDFCTVDYFRAMGIPLRRGRFFNSGEAAAPRVAIIDETMAREYFPNEDPIGRQISQETNDWEIVGIVGDVRVRGLAKPVRPLVYRLHSPLDTPRNATLVVRTRGDPKAFARSVHRAILEIDPAQPVANVRTLEEVISASVAQRRLTLVLLGSFAGVALLLTAIGLYGVIAYVVTQRTREIGIRMALGANRGSVLALVLRQGMTLAVLGVALGVPAALGLTRVLTSLLYEVKPGDPLTVSGVSLILLLVALLACWLPARRAAKVDPMEALRYE